MADFQLKAEVREKLGKGASRRLRRESNLVPGIVYGGNKEPQSISLKTNELAKQLENEAFYSHIITLNIGSTEEIVILKDLQRHPAKEFAMHIDFMRLVKGQKFSTKVPLHFINEETCHGVKIDGGVVSHLATDIDITCLPKDLPEYIEVNMQDVKLGDIVHISDLQMPEGVESVDLSHGTDHDHPLASVQKAKSISVESEDDAAETADEEGSEEGDEEGKS